MFDLDTPELRAKLARRREPYWMPIQKGRSLGYRRGANGGTWIARWRDPNGRKRYRSLGEADDEGCPGLSYDDAEELAARFISSVLEPRAETASDSDSADAVIDETAAAALVEAVRSSRFKPPPIDLAALARDLTTAKRLYDSRLRRWRPSRTVIQALDRLATSSRELHDPLAVVMADTTGRHLLCWGWSFSKSASGDVLGAVAAEAMLTRLTDEFNTLRRAAQIAHRLAEDAPSAEREILDTRIEYDLIGRILPSIYERHFKRLFGVSRIQLGASGSRLIGPGVRFVMAAIEVIGIRGRAGHSYRASVILDALNNIKNRGEK